MTSKDEKIRRALLEISPREEKVIRFYYGLTYSRTADTLQKIGEHFHITKERVRQIREKAVRRIAKECRYKPSTVRDWLNKQREEVRDRK